jgi:hypothetical protein
MNTKTRNTPTAPGAMTPAELTQRAVDRIRFIVSAVALTATAIFTLALLLLI